MIVALIATSTIYFVFLLLFLVFVVIFFLVYCLKSNHIWRFNCNYWFGCMCMNVNVCVCVCVCAASSKYKCIQFHYMDQYHVEFNAIHKNEENSRIFIYGKQRHGFSWDAVNQPWYFYVTWDLQTYDMIHLCA